MTWCKNCFGSVDMRRDTKCATCNSPLHKECAIKEDGTSYCDVCYTVKEETKEKETEERVRKKECLMFVCLDAAV